MKNYLHSTFHIVYTIISLKLSTINSKSSGRGYVFYNYIYYIKIKIKNEFNIKPKSDLEHITKLNGIMEIKKFLHIEVFYILVSNTCIACEICHFILVYKNSEICVISYYLNTYNFYEHESKHTQYNIRH